MKPGKLQPALFLHIQKTAGSTIVDLARSAYGSENVISHGDYLTGLSSSSDNLGGVKPFNLINIPFISGHFGYGFASGLMEGRFFFTFLRDPVERILSYYHFCRTRNAAEYEVYALAQQLEIDDFLALGLINHWLKTYIWNQQAWQLANGYAHVNGRGITRYEPEELMTLALDHLDAFSHIGFVESFEVDRDIILNALGIPLPKKKLVSNANPGRPLVEDLPPSTLSLLNDLTELDRALYKEAWSRRGHGVKEHEKIVAQRVVSRQEGGGTISTPQETAGPALCKDGSYLPPLPVRA
jgi:hypothetical protein